MQAGAAHADLERGLRGLRRSRLGSLEVGKLADVAVLGDDPMTFPAAEFHHLPIAVTISGGKVVFRGEPTMAMPPMRGGPARGPRPGRRLPLRGLEYL